MNNSINFQIIKNIVINYKCSNYNNKNIERILENEYIMKKIIDHPEYIFIIIYKLNIQYLSDLYILYTIYLLIILHKENVNVSLLNISILALKENLYRNIYFKEINKCKKLISYSIDNNHYNAFKILSNSNNNLIKKYFINDYSNLLK